MADNTVAPEPEQEAETPTKCRNPVFQWAKIVLPHVGLICLSCLYVAAGAVVFYHLEEPNEQNVKRRKLANIKDARHALMQTLWTTVSTNTSASISQLYSLATGKVHRKTESDVSE